MNVEIFAALAFQPATNGDCAGTPGTACGFRLEKANPVPGEGEPDYYDVLLDGERSTCECKGFLRYGHRKHVESVRALVQCGKLSVPAPKQQPFPEPIAFDSFVCLECGKKFRTARLLTEVFGELEGSQRRHP